MKLLAIFLCIAITVASAAVHWDPTGQYRLVESPEAAYLTEYAPEVGYARTGYAPYRAYYPYGYNYVHAAAI